LKCVIGGALFLVAFGSGVASATAPAPSSREGNQAPAHCPELAPGGRLHDGFFARSESGLAGFWAQISGSGTRTGSRGIGQSAALSLGGTPLPGLVLGGVLWTARLDPTFENQGVTTVPDDDSVKITQLRLGPFLDFYPDPSRGFHAQAGVQFVPQSESDTKGNPVEPAALGAALSLGTGYEWFIAPNFSLGFLAHAAFGYVVRAPASGDERMRWVVPELTLAATYH
jgi:hypothetical protein